MEGEMVSAEEFFADEDTSFVAEHDAVGKKSKKRGDKLFEETKIRMVMRIHKLSRNRAKRMIEEVKSRCEKASKEPETESFGLVD